MGNKRKTTNVFDQIKENYVELEKSIVSHLQIASQHHVTTGVSREEVWKSLFEQIVPKKFSIERSVFILDSERKVSKEVDLAIFDEQYTPYIFNYRNMKYIPIEAVAVVIQCKSNTLKPQNIQEWVNSINELKTSLKAVARLFSSISLGEWGFDLDEDKYITKDKRPITQTSTRPLKILCHTGASTPLKIQNMFDIVLNVAPKDDRLAIYFGNDWNLGEWYESLNHVKDPKYEKIRAPFNESDVKTKKLSNFNILDKKGGNKEITLLSFIFQLNQLLMLLNNPLLFPHFAYAEMFNRE
jgi:hypothetical protein